MTDAQERGDGAMSVAPMARYAPGPWTLIARAGISLLADVEPSAGIVAACWDAIERGVDIDTLPGVIMRGSLRAVPGFVLVGQSGTAVKVLVGGTARAQIAVTGAEPVVLSAAQSPTWVEQEFPDIESIRLVADSAAENAAEPDGMLPLQAGVVGAGTVLLTSLRTAPVLTPTAQPPVAVPEIEPPAADVSAAPDEPARSFDHLFGSTQNPLPILLPEPAAVSEPEAGPEPDAQPESAQPPEPELVCALVSAPAGDVAVQARSVPGLIESLPWQADAELAPSQPFPSAPTPLVHAPSPSVPARDVSAAAPVGAPTVRAVLCANRHLSPPDAGSCRVCGARIRPQEPFTVPRPALGVLCLSTGEAVPLDRDVLLGRAPSAPPPGARPVRVPSPNNDVSRNHVRISVEEWQVRVTDLGSTNGTVVTLPGQQPIRLRPHAAFTIIPDTVLNVADEVFARFEVPRTLG